MVTSALLLRLTLDVLVLTGVAPDLAAARRYVRERLAEFAQDPAILELAAAMPPASNTRFDPARQNALDSIAGAFLQISENFELLAEPTRPAMAKPPSTARVHESCPE